MSGLEIYKWIAGDKNDFTRQFKENEALFNQVKTFWKHLDGEVVWMVIIMVVVGVLCAFWYYQPFNNKPGRHYRIRYWLGFMLITIVTTFIVTLVVEYIMVKPVLPGAFWLESKVALGNAIYAVLVYILTSLIWCNFFSTNAYKFLKIKKK